MLIFYSGEGGCFVSCMYRCVNSLIYFYKKDYFMKENTGNMGVSTFSLDV